MPSFRPHPSRPARRGRRARAFALAALLGSAAVGAESIDWYTVDSGGGSSSGGGYTVVGTAGQGDATAAPAVSATGVQVAGGFWSGVQNPAPPGGDTLFTDSFE